MRVEETILEAPDGRKITTLVSATPIRTEEGEVDSVVVTLQDLTPLEEFEVHRAEFLGMVSHELRAPLTSIKGSAVAALEASSDLRPAETLQFFRIINQQADRMRAMIGDLLDAAHIETGRLSVAPEPVDLSAIVDQAREPVSERWRQESAPDRSAAEPATGTGGPAARRPGPGQPVVQRGPSLAAVIARSGGGGVGGGSCGGFGR